jgi:hypothetical protein
MENKLRPAMTESKVDDVCEGCNGHGEVGGLTPQGYDSQECPFCHGTGKEAALAQNTQREAVAFPMTEQQVRQWIDACNSESARQVLRDYLRLRTLHAERARVPDGSLWSAVDRMIVDAWELGGCETQMDMLAMRQRYDAAIAGWKLVPIEPTWDMRNEGRELLIDGLEKEPERLAYALWKAMLAAAPSQPKDARECKCSLRQRLVGDGCQVCNPELAAELAAPSQRAEVK